MANLVVSYTLRGSENYAVIAEVIHNLASHYAHTDESEYRIITPYSAESVEAMLTSVMATDDELRVYTVSDARTVNADPEWHYGAQWYAASKSAANSLLRKLRNAGRLRRAARRSMVVSTASTSGSWR
ncbi:hypothetical protein [Hyphomicrobium nitrativorans]|uniref:hypothetical protein n=1 Tax=Hyphomicrobium nitrativorans TaxID=1427356 RepID=UPI001184326E|nr:hypothetical protein [Hyphomicrobium nitrativorans]